MSSSRLNLNDYKPAMGERLRECRLRSNLTQEKMAELLDISVKHYSEVERGITGLSVEKLIFLSNLLNISLDYLLKGKCEPPEERLPYIFIETYCSCPNEKRDYLADIMSGIRQLLEP